MATYKRVSGDYTIQTLGANTVTISSALANTAVDMVVDGNLTVTGSNYRETQTLLFLEYFSSVVCEIVGLLRSKRSNIQCAV